MADVTLTHPDHDGRIVLDDVADAGRIRILSRQDWVTDRSASASGAPPKLDSCTVDELRQIAEDRGIDISQARRKADIIAALAAAETPTDDVVVDDQNAQEG